MKHLLFVKYVYSYVCVDVLKIYEEIKKVITKKVLERKESKRH